MKKITDSHHLASVEILSHFPQPILILTKLGRISFANAACAQLLNMDQDQIVGQAWPGLDANLTLIHWQDHWNTLQKTPELHYATDVMTGNGLLQPVKVAAIALPEDEVLVVLKNNLPVQALREELNWVSQQLHVGYWRYNRVQKEWKLSDDCYHLLGLDPVGIELSSREAIWNVLGELIRPDQLQSLEEKFSLAIDEGVAFEQEIVLKDDTKNYRLNLTAQPVRNALHTTFIVGTLGKKEYTVTGGADEGLAQFALDHAKDMICWLRSDGTFAYLNQSLSQKLGLPESALLQRRIVEFLAFTSKGKFEELWQQWQTEKQATGELILLTQSGSHIPIQYQVHYNPLEEDELTCLVIRDVSRQKRRSKLLELTQFTIDHADELILWIRVDGTVYYANQTFFERTDYRPEEVEEQRLISFFPTASEAFRKQVWERLRKEEYLELELPLLLKDNTTIPVKASMNYIQFEGEEYDCLFLRDWSKKKERDRWLQLAHATINQAHEYILWTNEKEEVVHLNQAILDLIGGSREEWLGRSLYTVFPNLKPDQVNPSDGAIEISLPSNDGATTFLELSFSEVEVDTQKYLAIFGRNFTSRYFRRKQLEEARRKIEDLKARLEEDNIILREDVKEVYSIDNIITVSPKYQKVLHQVSQVAEGDTTVLILGETGTGKELLARAVHSLSEREEYPLIKVNCAALPETLIESELFGHEKGAFTGAQDRKRGRFEMADKGTIFLDEIGEMPLALQVKLLRVLQEGEFERIGGTATIQVDVRLIAATNRNLEDMVAAGKFRADLYYRLNVFPIVNIPLRERPEDIPVLTEFFARRFAKRLGKTITKINAADLKKLENYRFPGNIRELENMIERAVVLADSDTLSVPVNEDHSTKLSDDIFLTFDEMQREYILKALRHTNGRITGPKGAGRILGLNDRTLMSKMRKYKIEKREYIV